MYLCRRGERVVTWESFSSRFLHPPSAGTLWCWRWNILIWDSASIVHETEDELLVSSFKSSVNVAPLSQPCFLSTQIDRYTNTYYNKNSRIDKLSSEGQLFVFMMCCDETCLNNQNSISLILFNLNSVASGWQRPILRWRLNLSFVIQCISSSDLIHLIHLIFDVSQWYIQADRPHNRWSLWLTCIVLYHSAHHGSLNSHQMFDFKLQIYWKSKQIK